jgi:hypothetical protein
MVHGSFTLFGIGPWATDNGEDEFTNPQLRQYCSRDQRVTGIEPALSAWELFELMGMCLIL